MGFYLVAVVIQLSHNTQNNPLRSNEAQNTKLHNNKQKYTTVRVTYYTQ
jgi:hypothetical protein